MALKLEEAADEATVHQRSLTERMDKMACLKKCVIGDSSLLFLGLVTS